MVMRSSMKPSVRQVMDTGMERARGLAWARGMVAARRVGWGVIGWAGLRIVRGSQSLIRMISLERSVTISEKVHHVGGLGEPPKVKRSAMYAMLPNTAMDWMAAAAEWAMRRYASE
jgi:hypothetical protein